MSLSKADRTWLRRVIREVVADVVHDELEKAAPTHVTIGGFSPVDVEDTDGDYVERFHTRIGFSQDCETGNVK